MFYGPQLRLHLEFIENELGKSTWFAGDELTGAGKNVNDETDLDIMMCFPAQLALIRADTHGMEVGKIKDFLRRMEERPAYKRVIDKVGPAGLGISVKA